MNNDQWQAFSKIRSSFKTYCINSLTQLGEKYISPYEPFEHQNNQNQNNQNSPLKNAILSSFDASQPSYAIETPLVYNHALDEISTASEIELILVTDNPGREEQKCENQRYLVGQAGKICNAFFSKHPELKIDFRSCVIVLNKSIIHTPKTHNLTTLLKNFPYLLQFFQKDQKTQAQFALSLASLFNCPLWISGYSELKTKGLFASYADTIREALHAMPKADIYLYQHFSRNCFSIQLKKEYDASLSLQENLQVIGLNNRKRILGI